MLRRHQGFIMALALFAHCVEAEPAHAQEPAQEGGEANATAPDAALVARAEAYASAACEAYSRKEYVQAVALYEQALSAAPNAALVLYNIARIYDVGLHSRGLAIDYYHRFMTAPNAAPEQIMNARARIAELEAAERAAVAEAIAAEARTRATTSAVQHAEPPTRGAPTPPSAVALSPAPPIERPPIVPAPIPRVPPASNEAAWSSREVAAIAVGGAGVASVGVGIGFLLSARAKSDIWKPGCDGNACNSQRAVNAAESASRQVAIGTTALIAGGALLAVGGVLGLVNFSGEKPAAGASAWGLSPVVGRSEISAALSGRF